MHKKITNGFVIQVYDGTRCVSQEFVAGQVEYEGDDDDGNSTVCDAPEGEQYQPFNMVQPDKESDEDYEALEDWTRVQDLTSEDLDELVHDIVCGEASAVNNSGMTAQVAFLAKQLGGVEKAKQEIRGFFCITKDAPIPTCETTTK